MEKSEIEKLVIFSKDRLDLASASLSEGYFYDSLPLCVIDAIFSIGVRYTSVTRVVDKVVNKLNLRKIREDRQNPSDTYKVIDAIHDIEANNLNNDFGATSLFNNRQRTSTRNGILKSEAVYKVLNLLYRNGINDFETLKNHQNEIGLLSASIEEQFKLIPGQSSGVSLSYFYMLTGNDNFVKVDRWILRFVFEVTGVDYSNNIMEVQNLLRQVCTELKKDYPFLNPRLYDHTIWKLMSKA